MPQAQSPPPRRTKATTSHAAEHPTDDSDCLLPNSSILPTPATYDAQIILRRGRVTCDSKYANNETGVLWRCLRHPKGISGENFCWFLCFDCIGDVRFFVPFIELA